MKTGSSAALKQPSETKILVVDDEADLREIIAFDFESAGYQVETAENGIAAMEVFSKGGIDAVVSDIRMPKSDGVSLLKQIKAPGVHKPPVMVFITGFSDLAIQDAFNMGIDGFFAKPFDRRHLVQSIGRLLKPSITRWTQELKTFSPAAEKTGLHLKLTSLQSALDGHYLALGRGGLFVAKTGQYPSLDQSIPFKIEFEDGSPTLSGSGFVRWTRSRSQDQLRPGLGFEFESLTPPSVEVLSPLLEQLESKGETVPFIPKG